MLGAFRFSFIVVITVSKFHFEFLCQDIDTVQLTSYVATSPSWNDNFDLFITRRTTLKGNKFAVELLLVKRFSEIHAER